MWDTWQTGKTPSGGRRRANPVACRAGMKGERNMTVKVHEKGGKTREINTEEAAKKAAEKAAKKAAKGPRKPKLMRAAVLGAVQRLGKRVARIGKLAKGFPAEILSLLDGIEQAASVAAKGVEGLPADFAPVRTRKGKVEITVGAVVTVKDKFAEVYAGLFAPGAITVSELRGPMVGVQQGKGGALTLVPRACLQVVKVDA